MKNQQENNALLNGTDVLNVEQRTKDFKGLCCRKVEAIKYFELLGMRCCELNLVTQKV